MKFTDGQWVTKPEFDFLYPQQVFDARFADDELTVFVYTKPVSGRGQTLDQATLTLHFTSDLPDTIRVQANHYEGIRPKGPAFACRHEDSPVRFAENAQELVFTAGRAAAVITRTPFSIRYTWDGEVRTQSAPRAMARISDRQENTYMREQLTLDVGEYVYGLGERFTAFCKNGQQVEMWNEDGGTASELTYKNIPFYLTNRNYGIFVDHPEKVSFEVASEQVERVQFSVSGEQLHYVFIGGDSPKQVLQNYCGLTGKPALPPAWSFGLWLTTSFTTSYDEKTVNSFIDGMAQRDLPLHVFHFDCFWMEACEWCNFEWDKATFPDPRAMLRRLKAKGLKICVWINPYIAQKSKLFQEGMEYHYLVEKANGDVWQWDRWQAGMGLVDFTNPDACRWYQSKLRALLEMGVDCFKTDFGERIPTDVVWHNGADPQKMHNYYTYLYNQCVFDLLKAERGEGEAVLFARSATAGGQQFPVHWGGDSWGTYPSMAESLRGGLSLALSGFGFWSHDISGFENTATPDLYKRWVAFGLLSTHSRLHGSSSYRVPWLFDEEAVDVLRFFTNLRCRLMPYLWAQAVQTAQTGVPMLRPMVLEFRDPPCRFLDTQYMLGESLLVAPIFNSQGIVEYYVPEGTWLDFFTGKPVQGGRSYRNQYDYFSLPLLVRPNTLLAIGRETRQVVYDYAQDVTLHLVGLEDGGTAACTVYAADGTVDLTAKVTRSGSAVTVQTQGNKPFTLLLRYVEKAVSVTGAAFVSTPEGLLLTPQKMTGTVIVQLESE
ncbi:MULTISPECIES: alpha-xylosidase [Caproicibacterium]|uniref:alpha-D-xyloside xylohydrolase n=1 Tax=Caproicibacterium argilliputei TaxID=3030016 RepID=A0AA97H2H2_9FIRM|nr:alpha-xylosidase [Caproicibacterium argilliputei]WOC32685.1 alpha-xylosidase [Caproicibacterium argilliputei]